MKHPLIEAISIALAVSLFSCGKVQGQTFAIGTALTQTSPALTFEIDTNGTFTSSGMPENGTTYLSASFDLGAGTRMLWYPAFAAFRAGQVTGPEWDSTSSAHNVGQASAAFGYNTVASGTYSFAWGNGSAAVGAGSTAGGAATATGTNSFALGQGASATGPYSIALGGLSTAAGTGSFAASTAYVTGNYAFAIGESVQASGTASGAFGMGSNADSEASFVIGAYNVGKTESNGTPTTTSWVSGDPLFEIGNGTSSTPADAVVVYKDGTVKFSGAVAFASPVTVPQSGDIPMYNGN